MLLKIQLSYSVKNGKFRALYINDLHIFHKILQNREKLIKKY